MTRLQRKKSYAAKEAHAVRRILAHWNEAGPRFQGKDWYDDAREIARELHPNFLCAAGILAALSPRCHWSVNLRWAKSVCDAFLQGKTYPPYVSTFRNRSKAWRIAKLKNPTQEQVLQILGGLKTQNFFRNIAGCKESVTVDSWAAFAAEGRRNRPEIRGLRYVMLANAYRRAAQLLNQHPSTVQAVVWVKVRGSYE